MLLLQYNSQFLSLLDEAINLDEIVPVSFVNHFHAHTGRPRKHQLYPILKALLIQRIFSIPTDTLLIVFLKYSQELRDFCGFDVVPDGSKFTRFKQDFLLDLQSMFDRLVDLTEPICQKLDPFLASMTIFDTSGIEAWVTENNPKYANRIIRQLKAFKKSHNLDDSYDPYKAAYGSMPTHAASNQAIQQMYINGHFCYAYKFGILTNGLGIVRDITFYNKDFLNAHPDIVVEKKSDSPDEDKSLADSKALLPVLIDFFQKHPLIEPKTFLGDAAFDSVAIYKSLFEEIGFQKAFIPLKNKLSIEGNPNAIEFPKAKIGDCPYDFSFSGVKSAVLNYINHAQMTGGEINRADLAASFQKAVVDVLVEHTMLAAKDYGMTKIAIAGGVASNGTLRAAMEEVCKKNNYSFYRPSPIFCTDNAAMIGVAAYYEYIKGTRHGWDLNAVPNLKLGER